MAALREHSSSAASAAAAAAAARTEAGKPYKQCGHLVCIVPFVPYATLCDRLLRPQQCAPAPLDNGRVALIVERPRENARNVVQSATLSAQHGMLNSRWQLGANNGINDQICVMSASAIRAITGGDDALQWAAAGDNLFFDLELGQHNLQVGDRVQVGQHVVLQVSPKPHNGCSKFAQRYGFDALKLVNSPLGKQRRLRGIYFFVLADGQVNVGDVVTKLPKP